jgi:spore coat protein CotH
MKFYFNVTLRPKYVTNLPLFPGKHIAEQFAENYGNVNSMKKMNGNSKIKKAGPNALIRKFSAIRNTCKTYEYRLLQLSNKVMIKSGSTRFDNT